MRRILLALALVLVPLSGAAGQATPEQRIEAVRQRAAQAGIPVSLLDAKVAEGRAKGVPAERIATAVERRLASLDRARAALAGVPAVTPADLGVGADALDAGVDPAALGQLARAAAPDRRAVAIAVLTELVQQGLASDVALRRVNTALARGPDELRRLPGEVSAHGQGQARGRGGPPDTRGPATGVTHGQRAGGQGGGPPASIPGSRGKGNPAGGGGGNGNGGGNGGGNGNGGQGHGKP